MRIMKAPEKTSRRKSMQNMGLAECGGTWKETFGRKLRSGTPSKTMKLEGIAARLEAKYKKLME